MPHVYTLEENYENIADAIRSKLGVQTTYKPGDMAEAIESIGGGSTPTYQSKTAYPRNTAQTITPDSGYDGLSSVQIAAVTTSGLTAANVKAGTTVTVGDSSDADRIASVTGTFTSDANAAATDIISTKTAYVNGSKVTGSLTFQTIYSGTSNPSSSQGANGDIYIKVAS